MAPGVIDEVHVMDARRAGRHAREAGEAAVDMLDDLGRRRTVVLQHVLDQVDAPPRAVELVAEQHIGRAGRGAEAAMHAGAQDLLGGVGVRIGELGGGEMRLHQRPSYMRPGLRTPRGSNPVFTRAVSSASGALKGSNTGTEARTGPEATTSVACPPADFTSGRTMPAPASGPASSRSTLSQISPPPQSK